MHTVQRDAPLLYRVRYYLRTLETETYTRIQCRIYIYYIPILMELLSMMGLRRLRLIKQQVKDSLFVLTRIQRKDISID